MLVGVKVVLLPGDGVGPEVIRQARRVVDAIDCQIEWTEVPWGSAYWHAHGTMMSADALEILRAHDAVLMGAVGDPTVPDHEALWGLILKIRQELDLWTNERPARLLDGVPCPLGGRGPQDIDMLFVRENTEGEYSGVGGAVHRSFDHEVAIETAVFTRRGCERIVRRAFELASTRRGELINATKSNASRFGFTFWDSIVEEVAADFPGVHVEGVLVDALAARMIRNPRSVDVVVASNLFGDILTDIAAALQGGLGMAASANLSPGSAVPGLFEPVHGSAPDIAGLGIANPAGAIWSAALMLGHLGMHGESQRVLAALEEVCLDPATRTPDTGGSATTVEVGDAVMAALDRDVQPRDVLSSGQL
jgi:tartrate dehydrogenase/decarboxylase/D-malate dehydrogenase